MKTGIQLLRIFLDSRLRGNDNAGVSNTEIAQLNYKLTEFQTQVQVELELPNLSFKGSLLLEDHDDCLIFWGVIGKSRMRTPQAL